MGCEGGDDTDGHLRAPEILTGAPTRDMNAP